MRPRLTIVLASVVLLCSLVSQPLRGDSRQEYEYTLKAQFLSRFIHFVAWPAHDANEGNDNHRDFVVAVFGSSPITRHLDRQLGEQTVDGRPIRVRVIDDVKNVHDCSVLFLPSSTHDQLESILEETRTRPILTIGDSEGFAARGVLINFYQDDEFLRFEVNRVAIDESGLQFSSNLLRLARIVDDTSRP